MEQLRPQATRRHSSEIFLVGAEVRLPFAATPVQNKEGVARPVIEYVSCQGQGPCCPHRLLFLQQDEIRPQHPGARCRPPSSLWLWPCQELPPGSVGKTASSKGGSLTPGQQVHKVRACTAA